MPHATFRLLDEEVAVLDALATLRRGTRASALREIIASWTPPQDLGDASAVRHAHRQLRRSLQLGANPNQPDARNPRLDPTETKTS